MNQSGVLTCSTVFSKDNPDEPIHHFNLVDRKYSMISFDFSMKGIEITDPCNSLIRFIELSKKIRAVNGRIEYKNYYMRDISEKDFKKAKAILADDSNPAKIKAIASIKPFYQELLDSIPVYSEKYRKLDRLCKGSMFKGKKITMCEAVEQAAVSSQVTMDTLALGEFSLSFVDENKHGVQKISRTSAYYYTLIEEVLLLAVCSEIQRRPFSTLCELYRGGR